MKYAGFNPHARWDRHLPKESNPGLPQGTLDEIIEVVALFKGGKIYPQAFIWNNKEYRIKHITYNWQERRGGGIISYFSAACGEGLYQISFNNTSLGWRINKIIE
jgi:hypothetical protein